MVASGILCAVLESNHHHLKHQHQDQSKATHPETIVNCGNDSDLRHLCVRDRDRSDDYDDTEGHWIASEVAFLHDCLGHFGVLYSS